MALPLVSRTFRCLQALYFDFGEPKISDILFLNTSHHHTRGNLDPRRTTFTALAKHEALTKVNEYGQYGHEIDPKQTELHRIFCKKQPPWYHMTRKYAQCIQDIPRW